MDWFHAFILALVEGVSEFLPISSTGHQVLVANLLGVAQTDFVKSFEIIIQFGAILAVVVLYWQKLWEKKYLWKPLILALIPTMIVGLTLYKLIKNVLIGNPMITVLALIIGGVVMIVLENYYKEKQSHKSLKELDWKTATLIGVGQSISIVPGVSRAAATIFTGMSVGLKREEAVEFSFMLAIPTMLAATGLDLLKSEASFSSDELMLLVFGSAMAFIASLLAIRWLLNYVSRHNFVSFGIYRIVFGLLYWFLIIR